MSALWTDKSAALATNGQSVGAWSVGGISIDTRSLQVGDLFVPLKDMRDGHDFIPMAFEKGAGAVISEHPISSAPALIVDDSMDALRGLAIASRQRSSAKRIAVTGSVGKTSVKEMIAHMCREFGKTHASVKSYNNHWGVPFTLASMAQDTRFGIFEMGMNHAGELAELTQIVRPDIAVITNIAPAHLAHFENIKAIANAKAEILGGLVEGGIAILPRDSEHYHLLAKYAPRSVSFGWHEEADVRIIKTHLTPTGSRSILRLGKRDIDINLPLAGQHWVDNAACILLVAVQLGMKLDIVVNTLKNMHKLSGRGERKHLVIGDNKLTLIDESYNANPMSMAAAIAALGLNSERKIAVLGDMLELGEDELNLHAGLVDSLKNAGIDQVLCCGSRMKALDEALPKSMQAGWHENADTCLLGLKNILQNGDVIMVKGSNASGMGQLVKALSACDAHAQNEGDNANVL